MTRADFEERAAIIEHDGGLSRAEAEALALREIRDLAGDPPGILGELARADRRRQHPDLASMIVALGLGLARCPWGFDHVVADGETYRPAIDAEPAHAAFIVPGVEDGAVVDLVACTVTPQRMRSRLGCAAVVGSDEIERARETDAPLLVFDNTIRWLRGYSRGAVIVDWIRAAREIEGVQTLMCSAALAPRLRDATRRCWPRPTIAFAGEAMCHAA